MTGQIQYGASYEAGGVREQGVPTTVVLQRPASGVTLPGAPPSRMFSQPPQTTSTVGPQLAGAAAPADPRVAFSGGPILVQGGGPPPGAAKQASSAAPTRTNTKNTSSARVTSSSQEHPVVQTMTTPSEAPASQEPQWSSTTSGMSGSGKVEASCSKGEIPAHPAQQEDPEQQIVSLMMGFDVSRSSP